MNNQNKNKQMTFGARMMSFVPAFNGLKALLHEPNARLHAIATPAVIVAGVLRHLAPWQWVALSVAIALVWVTEALNTSIEKLCDYACEGQIHPAIKTIKDISAGAVLISALASVVIGIIVFIF